MTGFYLKEKRHAGGDFKSEEDIRKINSAIDYTYEGMTYLQYMTYSLLIEHSLESVEL